MILSPKYVGTARTAMLVVLASALAFAGCGKKQEPQQQGQRQQPTVPVEVAQVAQKNVNVDVAAIGTVEAVASVEVKPQVGGQIIGVHFEEGKDVKKGQLLFTLDRRTFESAVTRAEGALARDAAQHKNAEAQARRYASLFKEGLIPREQFETVQANAEALAATVEADRAALQSAKLDLQYTRIVAPMEGRTGNLMVHAGNIVKANETALVKINRIAPIDVGFTLPEQQLAELKRYSRGGKLPVQARPQGETAEPLKGQLTFIDNSVDPATGTIKLKATFPNSERRLWPGQFVEVALTLRQEQNALVVPSQAVQTGQKGDFVFVVKQDMTAESRPVVVSRSGNGEAVITSGVSAGEQVVTNGHLRLVPGAKVQIKNATQAKESSS